MAKKTTKSEPAQVSPAEAQEVIQDASQEKETQTAEQEKETPAADPEKDATAEQEKKPAKKGSGKKKSKKIKVKILAVNMAGKYHLPYSIGTSQNIEESQALEMIENGDAEKL